ncbi:MAG: pyruvate kinase [Verrucomicrobiota bacterium]
MTDFSTSHLQKLHQRTERLRDELRAHEAKFAEPLAAVDPSSAPSARNLVHYHGLRSADLRALQKDLAAIGLSSLGRSERWVLGNVEAVLRMLEAAMGQRLETPPGNHPATLSLRHGTELLEDHADQLFGPHDRRRARIMVTAPDEAVGSYELVRDLLACGMDCLRINCAHGDEGDWSTLLAHLERARRETGRGCRTFMDLVGPNPRTRVPAGTLEDRRFSPGDRFALRGSAPSAEAKAGPDDLPLLETTLEGVLHDLRPGQRLLINDGKIATKVLERRNHDVIILEVTHCAGGSKKLKSDKGINLPDTPLDLPSLTEEDRALLPFVAAHADLIGYSFVRRPSDILALEEALDHLDAHVGIVPKLETTEAFRHLPDILLTLLRSRPAGVMIARGDMAVEIGFERLAEVQEEILWFGEAAHLPVIWATQVLQSHVKKGLAERGEITDAAMASRAECVMLNKGPHVLEAVRSLDDVLGRMHVHFDKKRPLFRPLSITSPA